MNENEIQKALERLTEAVNKGFSDMDSRFQSIENRLGAQEKQAAKTRKQQKLQQVEIDKLKKIVCNLAEQAPIRTVHGGTAIPKSEAYPKFEECGISSRAAMRELRKAGMIRVNGDGRNTCPVWIDGKAQRVIIVEMEPSGKDAQ